MSRYKHHLEIDVHEAALDRIRHALDLHDSFAVCFSGGKDSGVVLELVYQVAQERGISKVPVLFRDEEVIPDSVIDHVDRYRQEPWVDMYWFCVPLEGQKFIMGRSFDYIQWDPNREPVRPKPPWGITDDSLDKPLDQYTADGYIATAMGLKGSIAFINGIRADESLIRYRSCVNKLNENYICGSGDPRVSLVKPIYDWSESDIFFFFHTEDIPYAPIYDAQLLSGAGLRVATPLHAESAKRLGAWRSIDPEFHNRVLKAFPEMAAQERWWKDFDKSSLMDEYGQDYAGVRRYINEYIKDEGQKAQALSRVRSSEAMARKQPESYPPDYILSCVLSGALKRQWTPLSRVDIARRKAKSRPKNKVMKRKKRLSL